MADDQMLELKLGEWGPPSAGKSVYLTVLYGRMTEDRVLLRDKWFMDLEAAEDDFGKDKPIRLKPEDLRAAYNNLRKQNELSRITPKVTICSFTIGGILGWKKGLVRAHVLWYDNPGQDVVIGHLPDGESEDIFDRLGRCDGILCFIDPRVDFRTYKHNDMKSFYLQYLRDLFETLRERDRQHRAGDPPNKAFAFVVTKSDTDERLWNGKPRAVLQSIVGDDTMNLIRASCPVREAFVCSSVGAILDERGRWLGENAEMVKAEDGSDQVVVKDLSYFRPVGLIEPIKWLLDKASDRRR